MRKTAVLFLTVFFAGLFLPLMSQAVAGTYVACPPDHPFYDRKTQKCCKMEKGKIVDCSVNRTIICYEGFVPCGLGKPVWVEGQATTNGECTAGARDETGVACQFCHLFVMLDGIIDFLLIKIVPFLAIGIIVLGGIMFYFGGSKPDLLRRGKKLITGVIIGLFLIYGAFMIVGVFLSVLGVTEWTQLSEWASGGPFRIACEIY